MRSLKTKVIVPLLLIAIVGIGSSFLGCLLYTSDAADER